MAVMEKGIEINPYDVVNLLLDKAGFSSFTFGCHFVLTFDCCPGENLKLPSSVELVLDNDWWFGDESEWKQLVRKMTDGQSYVEPEEPVLAFKLAALRWSAGSTVQKVNLLEDRLVLIFESGESISIWNHSDDDSECAWEIVESGFSNAKPDDYWWVSCDTSGNIDYHIPARYNYNRECDSR